MLTDNEKEAPSGASFFVWGSRHVALDLHDARHDAEQSEGKEQRAARLLFLLQLEHHNGDDEHGDRQQEHGQAGNVQHVHLPQDPQQHGRRQKRDGDVFLRLHGHRYLSSLGRGAPVGLIVAENRTEYKGNLPPQQHFRLEHRGQHDG